MPANFEDINVYNLAKYTDALKALENSGALEQDSLLTANFIGSQTHDTMAALINYAFRSSDQAMKLAKDYSGVRFDMLAQAACYFDMVQAAADAIPAEDITFHLLEQENVRQHPSELYLNEIHRDKGSARIHSTTLEESYEHIRKMPVPLLQRLAAQLAPLSAFLHEFLEKAQEMDDNNRQKKAFRADDTGEHFEIMFAPFKAKLASALEEAGFMTATEAKTSPIAMEDKKILQRLERLSGKLHALAELQPDAPLSALRDQFPADDIAALQLKGYNNSEVGLAFVQSIPKPAVREMEAIKALETKTFPPYNHSLQEPPAQDKGRVEKLLSSSIPISVAAKMSALNLSHAQFYCGIVPALLSAPYRGRGG